LNDRDDNVWLQGVSPEEMHHIVDTLYRVHRLVSFITDLDVLLERIMEEGKRVACAEACSLLLYDDRAGDLYFQIAQGESGDQQALKRSVRLKLSQGIAGAAAATRQSINVKDVDHDPRFYRTADEVSHFRTRSLLAVPMMDRDVLVGVIEVVNKVGGGAFTDTDLHVMEMFSSLAATSLVNARLIEQNLRAERMAAIGQAVAGLSHYTKNIITGMTGSTELIDDALRKNQIGPLHRVWPILKRSLNRISDFVQDMLAFSKPREPLYEACTLRNIIDDAVRTYTDLLTQKNIDVEVDYSNVTGSVEVDSQGLYRCLVNLITNAGEAVAPRTGKIWITARDSANNDLVIEVADNGPGVAPENRSRIFEPFFSTKGAQGTGLGLAVTHKIIREHHGEIAVEDRPGGGALFRIVLQKGRPA